MTHILQQPGPILESKGTGANFQKEQNKDEKGQKYENLGKNVQN